MPENWQINLIFFFFLELGQKKTYLLIYTIILTLDINLLEELQYVK